MNKLLTLGLDLTTPDPIPEAGIARATELMRSGRLFRYGEVGADQLEASALEQEFADYLGARYCVAVSSGGAAMFIALKCAGVRSGSKVLVNAFTLAPVPGAVAHACADTIWVECGEDLLIDADDLERKAKQTGATVLMLSHMRGHIANMDALSDQCAELGLTLIEDCAHTMGAAWNGKATGRFGIMGCFSTQTFKHINSGEGGLLVTDDEHLAAKAILYSGSYMLHQQHGARPSNEVLNRYASEIPNFSLRMSALEAAILRPQLALLEERAQRWNALYGLLADQLNSVQSLTVPLREPREQFVASSIQFSVDLSGHQMPAFVTACADRGVHIKWFGRAEPVGFTATFDHWGYVRDIDRLEHTREVLSRLCDMRIPLQLSESQCRDIAEILRQELKRASSVD